MNNLEDKQGKRYKCTDTELIKSNNILVESLVKILKTTTNLAFKYSILAKLKLNHLSSSDEIEEVLNGLLDKSIKRNSGGGGNSKKLKIDNDFDALDVVKSEDSRNSQDSILNLSLGSDFGELSKFELKSEKIDNTLTNDDFDFLENISNSLIKNDDFDVLINFKN